MDDEGAEAVRNWLESKSVRNIQVFLGFSNFYRRFVQGFSKIAGLLTSMLRTAPTKTTEYSLASVDAAEEDGVGDGESGNGAVENFGEVPKSYKFVSV